MVYLCGKEQKQTKYQAVNYFMNGMTGYSFKECYFEDIYIATEIKAVNHRFLDINVSIPYYLNSIELNVRDLIQKNLRRGKIDVSVSLKPKDNNIDIEVDLKVAGKYVENFRKIINEFNLKDEVKLFHLTRYDDILVTNKKKDYSQYWDKINECLNTNLSEIKLMREKEGSATKNDLLNITARICDSLKEIEKNIPVMEKQIFSNIKDKITDLIGDRVDEVKLLNEAAVMVSRSCINEEIERLKMHTSEFLKIADDTEDVGKRLDFICQEMHREINTIGSKVTLNELTGNVISIKNNIEKLREQIRNIE
jgi:uncharacterized protein (TIGR00255 family)